MFIQFSTELSTGSVDHFAPAQDGLIVSWQSLKLSLVRFLINRKS